MSAHQSTGRGQREWVRGLPRCWRSSTASRSGSPLLKKRIREIAALLLMLASLKLQDVLLIDADEIRASRMFTGGLEAAARCKEAAS